MNYRLLLFSGITLEMCIHNANVLLCEFKGRIKQMDVMYTDGTFYVIIVVTVESV